MQNVQAVRQEAESGEREGVFLKWGLIPSWAKEPDIGNSLANARADTVSEEPAAWVTKPSRQGCTRRSSLTPACDWLPTLAA